MKSILSIIAVILTATILSGSGNKATVWKYELPLSFYGEFDSIPTINQFGQVRNGIIVDNIISVYNADPNGVDLTNTQIEAFRMLVGGMYTAGTWQKCKAIYPFIGGSEYKHKWNIKDLRDLDSAFRLQFFGGLTHNSNGVTPNGTTGYANTFLIPNTHISGTGLHLSYYTNQNLATGALEYVMGASNGGLSSNHNNSLIIRRSNNSSIFLATGFATSPNNRADATVNDSRGLTIGTCVTNAKIFQRGVFISTNTAFTPNVKATFSIFLFGYNTSGSLDLPTNKPCQFSSIGSGLTDTEAIRQSNIVTQVQRHLSRQ